MLWLTTIETALPYRKRKKLAQASRGLSAPAELLVNLV